MYLYAAKSAKLVRTTLYWALLRNTAAPSLLPVSMEPLSSPLTVEPFYVRLVSERWNTEVGKIRGSMVVSVRWFYCRMKFWWQVCSFSFTYVGLQNNYFMTNNFYVMNFRKQTLETKHTAKKILSSTSSSAQRQQPPKEGADHQDFAQFIARQRAVFQNLRRCAAVHIAWLREKISSDDLGLIIKWSDSAK